MDAPQVSKSILLMATFSPLTKHFATWTTAVAPLPIKKKRKKVNDIHDMHNHKPSVANDY